MLEHLILVSVVPMIRSPGCREEEQRGWYATTDFLLSLRNHSRKDDCCDHVLSFPPRLFLTLCSPPFIALYLYRPLLSLSLHVVTRVLSFGALFFFSLNDGWKRCHCLHSYLCAQPNTPPPPLLTTASSVANEYTPLSAAVGIFEWGLTAVVYRREKKKGLLVLRGVGEGRDLQAATGIAGWGVPHINVTSKAQVGKLSTPVFSRNWIDPMLLAILFETADR